MLRRANPNLEIVADDVAHEHRSRDDLPGGELEPKPFRRRPEPRTSIISEAAARAYAKRMEGET